MDAVFGIMCLNNVTMVTKQVFITERTAMNITSNMCMRHAITTMSIIQCVEIIMYPIMFF